MNTIIISHESDVDGLFSASIALMRFPQGKIIFTSYGKENFAKLSEILYNEVIATQGQGQVIISDLGLNDNMIDLFKQVFSFLKSNSWSIIWVDHHPWSGEAIKIATEEGAVQVVLDKTEKHCATELMYERFLKGNSIAEELSKIAHTTDFFTKDQEIPPISELVIFYKTFADFYSRITKLAIKVSKGILWDTEMQRDYSRYSKLRDSAKTVTLNKIKDIDIGNGIKASIVPTSPYLQLSLFSQEVFEKTGSDVAFFLNNDGKISIRRNNENIDCGAIAKQLLDGGGHKFAAGGKLKSDHNNMDEIKIELKEALSNAIKK